MFWSHTNGDGHNLFLGALFYSVWRITEMFYDLDLTASQSRNGWMMINSLPIHQTALSQMLSESPFSSTQMTQPKSISTEYGAVGRMIHR
jgi:hypothetical protein